jgi:GcrA cell cycle regulator
MEPNSWAPEHSEALREYLARGMSYSQTANAINAKFGTCYSRNATIGRGKRMGIGSLDRTNHRTTQSPRTKPPGLSTKRAEKLRDRRRSQALETFPMRERAEPFKLRCVGLRPRLVALVDLEGGDCRYPYGGERDGDAILFCGHPRLASCSYCEAHFRLTRDDGSAAERMAVPVTLRLIEAA